MGLTDLVNKVIEQIEKQDESEKIAKQNAILDLEKRLDEKESSAVCIKKAEQESQSLGKTLKLAKKAFEERQPVPEYGYRALFGLSLPDLNEAVTGRHAFSIWKPFPKEKKNCKKPQFWRVSQLLGYGQSQAPDSCASQPEQQKIELRKDREGKDADILVIDDAGTQFRNQQFKTCWLLPEGDKKIPHGLFSKRHPRFFEGIYGRIYQQSTRID
jgi:hypothetical protein